MQRRPTTNFLFILMINVAHGMCYVYVVFFSYIWKSMLFPNYYFLLISLLLFSYHQYLYYRTHTHTFIITHQLILFVLSICFCLLSPKTITTKFNVPVLNRKRNQVRNSHNVMAIIIT